MKIFVRAGSLLAAGVAAIAVAVAAAGGTAAASGIQPRGVVGSAAAFTAATPLSVTVTPGSGTVGTTVTVHGTGYNSCPDYGDRTVNVLWDGFGTGTTVPIRSDGTITAHITVPSSTGLGSHYVYGQCVDSGEWARTTFTVTSGL